MSNINWKELIGCNVIIKDEGKDFNLKAVLIDVEIDIKDGQISYYVYINKQYYGYVYNIEIDYQSYIGRRVMIKDDSMWNNFEGVLKQESISTNDGYTYLVSGKDFDIHTKSVIPILYDNNKYFKDVSRSNTTLERIYYPNYEQIFNKFKNIFIKIGNEDEFKDTLIFFNSIGYEIYNSFLLYEEDLVLYTNDEGLIYSELTLVPKFQSIVRQITSKDLNCEFINMKVIMDKQMIYKTEEELSAQKDLLFNDLVEQTEKTKDNKNYGTELDFDDKQKGLIYSKVRILDKTSYYNNYVGYLQQFEGIRPKPYRVSGFTFNEWVSQVEIIEEQNYDILPILEKYQDKVGQTVIIDDIESIYHNCKGIFVGYFDDLEGGNPFQIQIINEHINENIFTFVSNVIFKLSGQKFSKDKLPMYTVLFKQFPDALKEVVKASQAGHKKYEETDLDWMNFKRVPNENNEYLNAMIRHLMEYSSGVEYVEDMKEYGDVLEFAAVVWNGLAHLQRMIEDKK